MRPVNWTNPINWSHPINKSLASWWLNVLHWQGGTVWHDLTKQNDGTLNNMSPALDWVGPSGRTGGWGALDFDGSDDYVLVSPNKILSGLTNMSILVWINTASTTEHAIYTERGSSGADILKLTMQNTSQTPGAIELTFRDTASTLNRVQGTLLVNNSDWHFVAMTKQGTAVVLYVDGQQDTTGTLTATDTFTQGTTDSRIGGDQQDSSANFPGLIDDCRIYTRTVLSTEISKYYQISQQFYPDILNRRGLQMTVPTVAANAMPMAMNHYRRRRVA